MAGSISTIAGSAVGTIYSRFSRKSEAFHISIIISFLLELHIKYDRSFAAKLSSNQTNKTQSVLIHFPFILKQRRINNDTLSIKPLNTK